MRDSFGPSERLKNTGCGNGEAFCDRLFALHLHQREKDKQFVDVSPPGKILRTPMAVASFHNSSAQFLKPAWCSSCSTLSVVASSYWSACLHCLCTMSVLHEKIFKDKQRFIDPFSRDPRRLQLLFSYSHFALPRNWQLVAALLSW